MPDTITPNAVLIFLFFAIVFGFGFAIGGWLWSLIVGAAARRRGPNA